MCGIFGIIVKKDSSYNKKLLVKTLERVALLSESRGKESSGFAFRNEKKNNIKIIRSAMPVSQLIKESQYKKETASVSNKAFAVIGHSRLVTNGSQLEDHNNQPVVKSGIVGIHNGIIVNGEKLWKKYPQLKRNYDIDTEVMLAIIRKHLNKGSDTVNATVKTIKEIFGTVATALFFDDRDKFILTTNNGSLYILSNFKDILIFASERFILKSLLKDKRLKKALGKYALKQISPCTGYWLDLPEFSIKNFDFKNTLKIKKNIRKTKLIIEIKNIASRIKQIAAVVDIEDIRRNPKATQEKKLLQYNIERIRELKRCKKCVLPETFPFIEFDKKGICNYCNKYILKNRPKSIEKLKRIIKPYKNKNNKPDVIVPLSGGRDSTFTLHMVKKELGLNPIAYTYDWGMVTDLARRNIARVCGKLGVENIIVSANIRKKRGYIKKKIKSWLKRTNLGLIPFFMSGDKYFFYHCNKLKKQTGIKLNIWGVNALESTFFKGGFAGLKPEFDDKMKYGISKPNHYRLLKFIGKNIILNPSYINSSIWDTVGSYFVKYISRRKDYYRFFDYYQWNEKEIEKLIVKEYDWETALDTNSTWRIGDGTASFYNYIYFTVAGFTESDTYRSNQIREGMLSREEALRIVEKENYPRYETIKWYLEIVGLDYKDTIKKINNIPKLYN